MLNQFISRRSFLTRSVAGIAIGGAAISQAKEPNAADGSEIICRILGKTGLKIPIVSMGVMNASLPELVKRAYDIGMRHFDTAAYYQQGQNEAMIGNVLKRLNARNQCVIATKVYIPPEQRGMSPAKTREFYFRSVEGSLKRLQTDHVDILYLHDTQKLDDLSNPGVREALTTLKKQGKARFIGFSTHMNMNDLIRQAITDSIWDVILTSFNYALSDDKKYRETLQNASAKGIGLIAMKTQASQGWYIEELPENLQRFSRGTLVHSAMLKWVMRFPFITTAVPGITTFDQMEDDFKVARNLEYTDAEKKFLTDRKVTLALGYCRQCSECVAQCPQAVDIPTLMRVHMYVACYRNYSHARQTLADIQVSRGLKNCADCGSCSINCSRGVQVARRISDLIELYGS